MAKRVNYLNNKDILKEIHKSKNSYCSFLTPEDHQYDLIVKDIAAITSDVGILEAKTSRADRIAKVAYDAAVEDGKKCKLADFEIEVDSILITDLVFRVMMWDHIPVAEAVKKKDSIIMSELLEEDPLVTEYDDELIKAPTKYTKVNFPPFQHYKIGENKESILVGKSHWKGDLLAGEFNKEHGTVTRRLADMYIKLVERYATRSNWRGYTYNDEMRSQALLQLSQIGLQFDESKSQNPFSYYTAVITNSFTRVLNIEKRNQNLRDDILEMNNFSPSYTRQNAGGDYGDHD